MKELVAVRRDILLFTNDLRGHTVCLYEDNQAVVAIIKNRTSSSPLLMNELSLLMSLLEQLALGASIYIYPQRAQPGRHLFKTDRPRRVDVVALCSAHAHAASASNVPQEYLARCLRLSTVKSDISLRFQTLRSRVGRGWTLARLEQRSRVVEPAVGVVARRSLQAPRGAPGNCAHRTSMVVGNVVAVAAPSRSIPRRAASAKVQCLAATQRKNEALPQHGRPDTSSLLSSW